MTSPEQICYLFDEIEEISVRQTNILRSPKQNGTALDDSRPYLAELGVEIIDNQQPIQFFKNSNDLVHRWSPYVQGFSAKFVQRTFDQYQREYSSPVVFDPFAGSGTVLTQSKLNNFESYGVELNPLLHFVAQVKIQSWQVNPEKIFQISGNLSKKRSFKAPAFLKSKKQFKPIVLQNL